MFPHKILFMACLFLLSGCTAVKPVIVDLTSDKTVIRYSTGDEERVMEEARKACRIHDKHSAIPLSNTCLDQYCLEKTALFACR